MDKLGQDNRPFLFIIPYGQNQNIVVPLDELDESVLRYDFSNSTSGGSNQALVAEKIKYEVYEHAFLYVKENILKGNSFLSNLTASTPLIGEIDLLEVYKHTRAKYKVWLKDNFVCFSPEPFVTVSQDGHISSFPMKGTIDSALPDAEQTLKSDLKEKYEHTTIVDLIRNDLSKVAIKIWVERFQYIERIQKNKDAEILQMSSEIKGILPINWRETLGTWFFKLLPAGSISGAPKPSTVKILSEAEQSLHLNGERGFYTGVAGVFDGHTLNSGVLIRFLEKTPEGFVFKSGGGITSRSDCQKEYEEIYQKLFIPG